MVNYYRLLSNELDDKIFKVRFLYKGRKMTNIERSLRLKKLEIEDEIEFHEKTISDSYPNFNFTNPSKSELHEYIKLYKVNKKVEFINPDIS